MKSLSVNKLDTFLLFTLSFLAISTNMDTQKPKLIQCALALALIATANAVPQPDPKPVPDPEANAEPEPQYGAPALYGNPMPAQMPRPNQAM